MDTEADLAAPGRLGEFLRAARERLLPAYDAADRDAVAYQRWHRRFIRGAAILAALAVISASVNSIPGVASDASLYLELSFAVASVLCVGVGLAAGWKKKWLLRRYQAERYRLLKFELLTEPPVWGCGPPLDWREDLERQAREIEALDEEISTTRRARRRSPTSPRQALARPSTGPRSPA